ncbi:MAG: pyruvoyl-dependent arginine decarboxylase [Meiothermus sp.]|nr:pyruvoyl-dependent arginine decarboxylase [Meiothermus sp.]
MRIRVTTGTGEGPTPQAAFDAALRSAGVANYNLLELSSVIPTGSRIERCKPTSSAGEYGHRLYVVVARRLEKEHGKTAWAGLGWTQERSSGRGLFVEIEGPSLSQVEQEIDLTLEAMKSARPIPYGNNESEIVGIECRGNPVCALAVAVYQSKGWAKRV